MTPDRHRIDDLEVMRALAIVCVLIQHSVWNLVFDVPWLGWFLGHAPLWCGVDLFFVVSGFVITRSLYPALRNAPRPSAVLRRFWMRRVFRLWPAAWFWLAFIVLGSLLFRDPPFMGTVSLDAWGALAGVLAFADLRFGLNGLGKPYGASFPYWSLSLEEQFYVLLPVLILLTRKRLGLGVCVLLLIQLPLAHGRPYFFLRTDGLLWGVLIAASPALLGVSRNVTARMVAIPFGGLVVLALALAAMIQLSPAFEQSPPFRLGELAAVAALPVWLASANRNLFHVGRFQPVALWLGSRSYALYLCHMPMFQCAAALSRWCAATFQLGVVHLERQSVLFGLVLLVAAAESTYHLIETPMRAFGLRLAGTSLRFARSGTA